ncbi:MAG: phosphoglucosamine mutase [Terriglobia bacterium]
MFAKPQLFGTDGIRGPAGRYPLDQETVVKLGRALGAVVAAASGPARPEILLGQDTRESSPWIASALACGLHASGARCASAGIITTPGVAFLTRHRGFAAGVMISASHNPYGDNGIKVFSSAGIKLSEPLELEVERALGGMKRAAIDGFLPDLKPAPGLAEDYLQFIESLIPPGSLISRLRLVVDCANGSACAIAPALFKRLGVEARIIHSKPTGRNINRDCGALYPASMAAATERASAHLGVAFDGDADRAIFASAAGRVLDGDHVLFAVAPSLKARGLLKGGAVVGTLMTNLRLETALKAQGIGLKRTAVGDRFVLDEMLRSGLNVGGEPSGHIIFSDLSLAGDGFITLIQMLSLLAASGETLDDLMHDYKPFPQVILNVRVREKRPLAAIPEVAVALKRCQDDLSERGRVNLRYSGTEPVARVMVEGEDAVLVLRHAEQIAAAVESALGNAG